MPRVHHHLDELGSDVHKAEVGLEHIRDAGLLNLDHHILTGLQPRRVHLLTAIESHCFVPLCTLFSEVCTGPSDDFIVGTKTDQKTTGPREQREHQFASPPVFREELRWDATHAAFFTLQLMSLVKEKALLNAKK